MGRECLFLWSLETFYCTMRGGVPWVWRRRLSVGVLAYLESRVRQRFRINNLVLLCAALCLCLAKCGTGEGGGVDNNGSLDATTADTTQSDTAPIKVPTRGRCKSLNLNPPPPPLNLIRGDLRPRPLGDEACSLVPPPVTS